MGDMLEVEGTVESSAESLIQNGSYVVHGAEAYCEMGSRTGRLTLPVCHGTYMHGMPVMTVMDSSDETNIKSFGFCNSLENPARLQAVQKVMGKVEEDKNLIDGMMDGILSLAHAIEGVFGFKEDSGNDPYHGYDKDVYQSVTVLCEPMIALLKEWNGGTDKLQINGVNALNSECTLRCLRDGSRGIIHIANDGQENAASEQSNAADMANWKAGDPYPPATQGNLEALDDNIAQLKAQMKAATSREEKLKIWGEIISKKKLRKEMSSTLNMVFEMQQVAMYAKDEATYRQAMEDINTVKEAFANGTPCVAIDEEQINNDLNKVYQIRSDDGDVNAYFAEKQQAAPYDSFNGISITESNANDVAYLYCNGQLMSQSEYNQYITDCVEDMMPKGKRDWLTGNTIITKESKMSGLENVDYSTISRELNRPKASESTEEGF